MTRFERQAARRRSHTTLEEEERREELEHELERGGHVLCLIRHGPVEVLTCKRCGAGGPLMGTPFAPTCPGDMSEEQFARKMRGPVGVDPVGGHLDMYVCRDCENKDPAA